MMNYGLWLNCRHMDMKVIQVQSKIRYNLKKINIPELDFFIVSFIFTYKVNSVIVYNNWEAVLL